MKKILLIIVFLLVSISLQADRGLQLKKMKEEQRVALVIGNNSYSNLSILKNPINDARAMKSVLENRGFEVIYKENASKRDMKKLLKKFAHKLKSGGVGLYYFAGHGISVDGKNFLVGTDSIMDDKDEVEYETLALNYVTKKMKDANNRLNIIILDACRNDPFSRSGGGGLAPVSNANGMFVAYATEAGSVASDGKSGKNGVFTKYLVKNMQEKGATIERVFKNTRTDVYDATNGKQSPGVYNQIRGDFYFTLPNIVYKNKVVIQKKVIEKSELDTMINKNNEIVLSESKVNFNKIKEVYKYDVSHIIKVTVPTLTSRGASVPIEIKVNEPGKIFLFSDSAPNKFIFSIKFNHYVNSSEIRTNIEMLESGYIYVGFMSKSKKLDVYRVYTEVSTPYNNINTGDNSKLSRVKIRARNNKMKILIKSPSSSTNYVNSIDFITDGETFANMHLSSSMTKNPLIKIVIPKNKKMLTVNILDNRGNKLNKSVKVR